MPAERPQPEGQRAVDADQAVAEPRRVSAPMFLAALVARTWLWFVAGCVAVTLLPLLLGWRPFVVESGSMQPRIDVGDVVLAAPVDEVAPLIGRVAVFEDPAKPGRTKTHRVLSVDDQGRMTTKGDANPTPDSATITLDQVHGVGRLLVQFAGLPLVWLHTQQWGWLGLFLLSLVLSALLVGRDRDEDPDDGDDGPGPGELLPLPAQVHGGTTTVAASRPRDPGLRRWALRSAYATVLAGALAVPSVQAALASTTSNAASTWTVRTGGNYATVVAALQPWMWWRLDETGTPTTGADASGNGRTASYLPSGSAFTTGATGALTSSPNNAVTLNGSTACLAMSSTNGFSAPGALTAVVWFRTTTTSGGKLLGFESPRTGVTAYSSGGRYDRHLYLDASGQVWFGTQSGTTPTGIHSVANLDNGAWHMAAGVLNGTSMQLYIDGALASSATVAQPTGYTGWWRAGCGNLSGWGSYWDGGGSPSGSLNQPRDFPLAGSLDEISVWNSALTATQIASIYSAR